MARERVLGWETRGCGVFGSEAVQISWASRTK